MLATLLTLSALASPPAAVLEAPSAAAMPEEDGLWLWHHTSVSSREGGLTVAHDQAVKIFTARLDREELFDPRLSWDDSTSDLSVDQARCWLADGTEVKALDNSLVPNTDGALQWAVPYASQRQLVVAQVGVEHGGACQLAWTVSHQPSQLPAWGVVPLAEARPISDLQVHVDVGQELRWATLTGEGSGEVQTGSKLDQVLTDVPAHDPAEGWPAPELVWSAAESWEEVRQALRARIDPAIQPEVVKEAAQEVLTPSMLDEARVAALHSLVSDGVRNIGWPVADFGYQARPAAQVLDSSVGHPLDEAVLLVSLLRADGIQADIALASSRRQVAWEVPNPDQLDQVWVVVEGERWLDPTGHHDQWDLDGHPVWLLSGEGGPEVLDLPGQDEASLSWELDISRKDEALVVSGSAQVTLTRGYHPDPDLSWDGEVSSVIPSAPGARAGEAEVLYDSEHMLGLSAPLEEGQVEIPGSGLVTLVLPRVPGAHQDLQIWRQDRTQPLWLPGLHEVVQLRLSLDEVEAVALPREVDLQAGGARLVRTVEEEGEELVITEVLTLQEGLVQPADWSQVREVLVASQARCSRTVLLE